MDLPDFIRSSMLMELKTIEMHTTGEPTRIVYSGFPHLSSEMLLEQRAEAQSKHDDIRCALMYEPRGHREMYGAVLRPRTELVASGQADIGVLFLTNAGYSTMCGHATLALGRLLVDCTGAADPQPLCGLEAIRDRLNSTIHHHTTEVELRLHVPCGLVRVFVPILNPAPGSTGWKCDVMRPISYLSVPSFATGVGISLPIPSSLSWPELGDSHEVTVDIAYGGTFYIIARPQALGFPENALSIRNLPSLGYATEKLRLALNTSQELAKTYLCHPDSGEVELAYGTILVDPSQGQIPEGTDGSETGLCFFANRQVDRSPTGSGVQARVAVACAKGERTVGQFWTYHSLVSNWHRGEGAFVGGAVQEQQVGDRKGVIVKVSGWAKYIGACSFGIEAGDRIGMGFWFDE